MAVSVVINVAIIVGITVALIVAFAVTAVFTVAILEAISVVISVAISVAITAAISMAITVAFVATTAAFSLAFSVAITFALLTWCLLSRFLQYRYQRVFSLDLRVSFHLYCPTTLSVVSPLSRAKPHHPLVSLPLGVLPPLAAIGMAVSSVFARLAADSESLAMVSLVELT